MLHEMHTILFVKRKTTKELAPNQRGVGKEKCACVCVFEFKELNLLDDRNEVDVLKFGHIHFERTYRRLDEYQMESRKRNRSKK